MRAIKPAAWKQLEWSARCVKLVESPNAEMLSWWCDSEGRRAIEGSESYTGRMRKWNSDHAGVVGP